ncbi:hypothetical protein ATANTOWER_012930 [Ataeniobius toweri]|uniref:Uncharacterized protein n=1 Tax=Ataeniobius toweri TaxID=208326 RepID=A0ABU7AJH7_9TELE|nr:hypothetical protein [Ataeniobius toweri]
MAGHSLRGARGRATAPPHREQPVEVARASMRGASWTPPSGGVPGTSHQEDYVSQLALSSPPEKLEEVSGEREVSVSTESAAPTTRYRIKRKMTSIFLYSLH